MNRFEMPPLNIPAAPIDEFRKMHHQSLEAQKALLVRLDQMIAIQAEQKDLLQLLVQASQPRP